MDPWNFCGFFSLSFFALFHYRNVLFPASGKISLFTQKGFIKGDCLFIVKITVQVCVVELPCKYLKLKYGVKDYFQISKLKVVCTDKNTFEVLHYFRWWLCKTCKIQDFAIKSTTGSMAWVFLLWCKHSIGNADAFFTGGVLLWTV